VVRKTFSVGDIITSKSSESNFVYQVIEGSRSYYHVCVKLFDVRNLSYFPCHLDPRDYRRVSPLELLAFEAED